MRLTIRAAADFCRRPAYVSDRHHFAGWSERSLRREFRDFRVQTSRR